MTTRALTVHGPVRVARYTKPAVTLAVGVASAIAIASSILLVLALIVAAAHALAETPAVRRRWARRTDRRHRRRRRDAREARLEAANVSTFELAELSEIVEGVVDERSDPYDLEPLLDRYAELAIAHQRCITAASPMDGACLEARLAAAKETHAKTAMILERRVAQSRTMADRARTLDQAMTELAELIRYCGERAALPDVGPLLESELVTNALDYCDAQDQL